MKANRTYCYLGAMLLIASLLTVACDLDEFSETRRQEDSYYKDKSECEMAVQGMYAAAQWIYGKNLLELVEFPSDYGRTTKTTTQKNVDLTLYQWIPTHETILGFYRDAYAAINRINNVIRNIDAADFLSEDDRNRMLGEARFMRGLHHLELARVFGEIPVKMTDTEGSNVTSYPKWKNEDIFKKSIIPDLTFAEQNLPFDAYADHRASGAAAKALLARTYLWLASCGKNHVMYHEWVSEQGLVAEYTDSVKRKCLPILESPKYGLYDKFYDVWLVDNKIAKNNVVENIFAINFEYENSEGNSYGAYFHSLYGSSAPAWDLTPGRDPVCLGEGYDGMAPTREFWEDIHVDPYDKRDTTMFTLRYGRTADKDKFLAAGGANNPNNTSGPAGNMASGQNFGIVKYRFQKGLESSAAGSAQMPVVRYADVLLMYAEAAGMGDATGVAAFEEVRKRACEMPNYTLAKYLPAALASEDDYMYYLLRERKIELCFERSRWFDMVRTGTLGSTISNLKSVSFNTTNGVQTIDRSQYFDNVEKRQFFPIPSRAIELNDGLTQNAPWK